MEYLIIHTGTGYLEAAHTLMRVLLGLFFMISGAHKLLIPARHAALVETLRSCGVPFLGFCQWFVPGVEFAAGNALVIGLLTPLAGLGLIAICFVAICTDGRKRVRSYQPIDRADAIDDYLYLPEVCYLIMLVVVVAGGAGPVSVDAVIISWLSS